MKLIHFLTKHCLSGHKNLQAPTVNRDVFLPKRRQLLPIPMKFRVATTFRDNEIFVLIDLNYLLQFFRFSRQKRKAPYLVRPVLHHQLPPKLPHDSTLPSKKKVRQPILALLLSFFRNYEFYSFHFAKQISFLRNSYPPIHYQLHKLHKNFLLKKVKHSQVKQPEAQLLFSSL